MRHSLSGDMGHTHVSAEVSADFDQTLILLSHGYLAYRDVGHVSQRPVLLIHGWGGASRYWRTTMNALSDAFRCVSPDLPGFGYSPPFRNPAQSEVTGANRGVDRMDDDETLGVYSHRGLARVVAECMQTLSLQPYDVIGHSYGCGVAIALAAMHPERVNRLIISNFSTFRDERERKMIVFMHGATGLMVKARRLPFTNSDAFATMLGGRYFYRLPRDKQILRDGLNDFRQMDAESAALTVKTSLGWETPQDLAGLQMPTLLIHCRNDQIMPPRNAEYTAKLAPQGQIAWIDQCGHLPMIEKPGEFIQIVRHFLRHER